MAEEKHLILVVETTAAMGPYWDTIRTDYLEKIIRSFGGNESTEQKLSVSKSEFALVTYNTHGCHSSCLVQRTGWTRDPDNFCNWLSAIPFTGGGFNEGAIAEGLAEALMMFPNSQSGGTNQQNVDMHRHCILVAASNPYPLRTPVYVPRLPNPEQGETIDSEPGDRLYDAEAVAKAFAQFSISLSVMCPKQLPKVKAIYKAGNQNNGAADPPADVKTTRSFVLISESFKEARGALGLFGITNLPSKQVPVKVEDVSVTPVTGAPPTSMPSEKKMKQLHFKSMMFLDYGLAANWPPVMHIVRLISEDHNKQYAGKADLLVFHSMNPHGFLSQLQERKLMQSQQQHLPQLRQQAAATTSTATTTFTAATEEAATATATTTAFLASTADSTNPTTATPLTSTIEALTTADAATASTTTTTTASLTSSAQTDS